MSTRILLTVVFASCLLTTAALAQFTREGGVSSIAGTLQKSQDNADDYPFASKGNQILFVDLDADLYIYAGSAGGHEAEAIAASVADLAAAAGEGCGGSSGNGGSGEEGGCSGVGESGEEESCGGSGKSRFVLEVLDASFNPICTATRPTKPGWDTDPRMACLLADRGSYILRVGFASTEEHAGGGAGSPKVHPYLLNVSLRNVAVEGSQLQLDKAVKESVNQLPDKN